MFHLPPPPPLTILSMVYLTSLSVLLLDVDECSVSEPVCHVNANCTNTVGSYLCSCKSGFLGDGKTCTGADCYFSLCIYNFTIAKIYKTNILNEGILSPTLLPREVSPNYPLRVAI